MIVVSNTSQLNYVTLIERIGILPALFGKVFIPPSVARELGHELAPQTVRAWIASAPPWLEVRDPTAPDPTISLGAGERDALGLALELQADILLMDDGAARRVASGRGLHVAGTLGVLELADVRELVDLPEAVEALRGTSYRIRADVVQGLLDAHSRRRSRPQEEID